MSRKMMTRVFLGSFEKSLNEKKWLQERSFGISSTRPFLTFILLIISNHTVFLVHFGINLNFQVFQKAEIALAEVACVISAIWKTHSCKLIENLNKKNRIITYTNSTFVAIFRIFRRFPNICTGLPNIFRRLSKTSEEDRTIFQSFTTKIKCNHGKWIERRSISSSCCVIVRVRVVLKRTVVGDWRFDNLSRQSSSESSE